jgi:hypothetical protein
MAGDGTGEATGGLTAEQIGALIQAQLGDVQREAKEQRDRSDALQGKNEELQKLVAEQARLLAAKEKKVEIKKEFCAYGKDGCGAGNK